MFPGIWNFRSLDQNLNYTFWSFMHQFSNEIFKIHWSGVSLRNQCCFLVVSWSYSFRCMKRQKIPWTIFYINCSSHFDQNKINWIYSKNLSKKNDFFGISLQFFNFSLVCRYLFLPNFFYKLHIETFLPIFHTSNKLMKHLTRF